jgi:hypothetical protein
MLAKFVPNFANRGRRVISATDPTNVNLDFLDPEPLLFHSSSSSVILTRLSGPVPYPLLLRKSATAGNGTRDLWICSHRGGPPVSTLLR